jgi:hypothetical protein
MRETLNRWSATFWKFAWKGFIIYQIVMLVVAAVYHEELVNLTNEFVANAGCVK